MHEAAERLHQLLPKLDRLMRQIDREVGATGAQLSALAAISEAGRDRLHLLAAHEGVSAPTMSRIVASLETKGWLTRSPVVADQRTGVLMVTETGLDRLRTCCAARTATLSALLSDLDEAGCRALERALRSIARGL